MRLAAVCFAALCLVGQAALGCVANPSSGTAYPASITQDFATPGAITEAWYDTPTDRYDHRILGRDTEPGTLRVNGGPISAQCGARLDLDTAHVFEDTAPRLFDLDGDGSNEVITVRTHLTKGAQIAVYGLRGDALKLVATTPYIGQRHRWLAPVGVADLDGDGAPEIAYVDRPHLAKILRVWRWKNGKLSEVGAGAGVSNHRIGDRDISGGIRDCGNGPEMIVADVGWTRILSVRFDGGRLTSRDIGPLSGSSSFERVLACR